MNIADRCYGEGEVSDYIVVGFPASPFVLVHRIIAGEQKKKTRYSREYEQSYSQI